jgi:alpha-beta hydrolase superfamily lysophospholipase
MKKFLKRLAYFLLFSFVFLNIVCAFQAYHFSHFYDNITRKDPQQMGVFEKTGAMLFGEQYPKATVVDSLKSPHTSKTITTQDKLKLAAWDLRHKDAPAKGTMIMFHGHGDCRSGIIGEADAFYNLGWNVLMIDFRAHGMSEGNLCTVGYFETKDVKAAYDYIVSSGEKNIVLYGVSMGAATIIKTMNDYASVKPAKVILEMPFATMLEGAEGRIRIMNLPDEPFGVLITFWGGTEAGIWAFANKPREYAKKITCPVLLQRGKKDPRVKEEEVNEIYKNIPASKKTLIEYDGVGHASICKNAHEEWMKNVSTFLDR